MKGWKIRKALLKVDHYGDEDGGGAKSANFFRIMVKKSSAHHGDDNMKEDDSFDYNDESKCRMQLFVI